MNTAHTTTSAAGSAVSPTVQTVPVPRLWDGDADVVVIGAGATGLPAAIVAREAGASVILVEAEKDIGGHAITSGGNIALGGGVAYRVEVRALQALEQDGAFSPPSPPPPARRQRGKATHLPRASHTALAGHCRPAMTVPDRRRPAGGCPAWHLSLGVCSLPETRGA
jgi:hypothetical protein